MRIGFSKLSHILHGYEEKSEQQHRVIKILIQEQRYVALPLAKKNLQKQFVQISLIPHFNLFPKMKLLGLSLVLMPTVVATSDGSTDSTLTNFDSSRYISGQTSHDRDHHRKVKVTVERTVDDDSTNGYKTKTVITERNVDDDNTDGSTTSKSSSRKRTKASASSPYAIPSDISETASTVAATMTARSSNSKHHHNDTITDDAISGDGGDDDLVNATTPIVDMMSVLNGNIDHDNGTKMTSVGIGGGKIVLPPEHEPSETWIVAIVTLFSSMAISLCITTAIRRCRKKNRRTGYQEVNNIVV